MLSKRGVRLVSVLLLAIALSIFPITSNLVAPVSATMTTNPPDTLNITLRVSSGATPEWGGSPPLFAVSTSDECTVTPAGPVYGNDLPVSLSLTGTSCQITVAAPNSGAYAETDLTQVLFRQVTGSWRRDHTVTGVSSLTINACNDENCRSLTITYYFQVNVTYTYSVDNNGGSPTPSAPNAPLVRYTSLGIPMILTATLDGVLPAASAWTDNGTTSRYMNPIYATGVEPLWPACQSYTHGGHPDVPLSCGQRWYTAQATFPITAPANPNPEFYLQYANLFRANGINGLKWWRWDNNLRIPVMGTEGGVPATVCTINARRGDWWSSCIGWPDYGTSVTFPASVSSKWNDQWVAVSCTYVTSPPDSTTTTVSPCPVPESPPNSVTSLGVSTGVFDSAGNVFIVNYQKVTTACATTTTTTTTVYNDNNLGPDHEQSGTWTTSWTSYSSSSCTTTTTSTSTVTTTIITTSTEAGVIVGGGGGTPVPRVTLPITIVVEPSGAPPVTFSVTGCSPSVSLIPADGASHPVIANAGCTLTLAPSIAPALDTRFALQGGGLTISATTCTLTSGSVCPPQTYTVYYQAQQTYQVTANGQPSFDSGLTFMVTGTSFGTPLSQVCEIAPTGGASVSECAGWADYGATVSLPTYATGAVAPARWVARGTSSFSNVSPGSVVNVNYYKQLPLDVTGGNAITYSVPSQTSDNYWDFGTVLSVSSAGVWGRASGTGFRVASFSIDGTSTAVSTLGEVTTPLITINSVHNVVFNTVTQHQLTLDPPSGTASSVPTSTIAGDSGWFDQGTTVSISFAPSAGSTFTGWQGTGSGSYTGPNNPASITMNAPITETALTVVTPPITTTTTTPVVTTTTQTTSSHTSTTHVSSSYTSSYTIAPPISTTTPTGAYLALGVLALIVLALGFFALYGRRRGSKDTTS